MKCKHITTHYQSKHLYVFATFCLRKFIIKVFYQFHHTHTFQRTKIFLNIRFFRQNKNLTHYVKEAFLTIILFLSTIKNAIYCYRFFFEHYTLLLN